MFHSNSIEDFWSQLVRIKKNFSGLRINNIYKLEFKGVNIKDYFNSWICFAFYLRFYLRYIEIYKLSFVKIRQYLFELLKIICMIINTNCMIINNNQYDF